MAADLCGICLDGMVPSIPEMILTCQHRFHADCVEPWLSKKGTCPTCRYQEVECAEESESDELDPILNYWSNRHPTLPSIEEWWTSVRERRQEVVVQQQPQRRLEDYAEHVLQIQETDTEWLFEIRGTPGQFTKRDVELVQTQTEASLPTCLYALHIHNGDIVNAILDLYEVVPATATNV